MGAAAPAVSSAAPQTEIGSEVDAVALRGVVLDALNNQPVLATMIEVAEWTLDGNTLSAKVAASLTIIEMSFTAEARRIASAAASGMAGRPIKVQVVPGGVAQAPAPRRPASNGSARNRAEQDPVVEQMKEKFGAEIRTVIDYREKG
jgi:DNA polymerase-3 subunit gamma/tau